MDGCLLDRTRWGPQAVGEVHGPRRANPRGAPSRTALLQRLLSAIRKLISDLRKSRLRRAMGQEGQPVRFWTARDCSAVRLLPGRLRGRHLSVVRLFGILVDVPLATAHPYSPSHTS